MNNGLSGHEAGAAWLRPGRHGHARGRQAPLHGPQHPRLPGRHLHYSYYSSRLMWTTRGAPTAVSHHMHHALVLTVLETHSHFCCPGCSLVGSLVTPLSYFGADRPLDRQPTNQPTCGDFESKATGDDKPGPMPPGFGPRRQIETRKDRETWYFEVELTKLR